jgi:hypothetical protein
MHHVATVGGAAGMLWPRPDEAMEIERSGRYGGLLYKEVSSDGTPFRFFLPNFFNMFQHALTRDRTFALLIGYEGAVHAAMGNPAEARACYDEARFFDPINSHTSRSSRAGLNP